MSKIEDVIIITGASSSIGEATARLLANRSAKVMPGARISSLKSPMTSRVLVAMEPTALLIPNVA